MHKHNMCTFLFILPLNVGVLHTMGSDIQRDNLPHTVLTASYTERHMDKGEYKYCSRTWGMCACVCVYSISVHIYLWSYT